ncbi:hypothetical protein KP509_32G032000 [Ceratopteris richardii]|nr:hypothetical protein KP509_32G032000 [Ceratopteris richardii]
MIHTTLSSPDGTFTSSCLECVYPSGETIIYENFASGEGKDIDLSAGEHASKNIKYIPSASNEDPTFHKTGVTVTEPEGFDVWYKESRSSPESCLLQRFPQRDAEKTLLYSKAEESQITIFDDSYEGFSDSSSQSFTGRSIHTSETVVEGDTKSNDLVNSRQSSLESRSTCHKPGHHKKSGIQISEMPDCRGITSKFQISDFDAWITFRDVNKQRTISPANIWCEESLEMPSSDSSDGNVSPLQYCSVSQPATRKIEDEIFHMGKAEPRTPSSTCSPTKMTTSLEATDTPVNGSSQSKHPRRRGSRCKQSSSVSDEWWDGKGIPNSTTKYKEDQKVSWHATPFEVRLERALARQSPSLQKKLFAGATTT